MFVITKFGENFEEQILKCFKLERQSKKVGLTAEIFSDHLYMEKTLLHNFKCFFN